jgi:hypothetical protein
MRICEIVRKAPSGRSAKACAMCRAMSRPPALLLKALLENEGFADSVQEIINSEAWKAARRKHAEAAA